MNKTRFMLIIAFVAAFAAGAAATIVSRPAHRDHGRGPWLARDLDLTESQQEQMQAIWEQAFEAARELNLFEQRAAIREEREQAVRQLLGEANYAQYQEIYDLYYEQSKKIEEQRRVIFDQAKEQSAAMLTDEQRAKWEELMERRRNDRRHRGGPGGGRRHGPPDGKPGPRDRDEGPGPSSSPDSPKTD